MSTQPSDIAAFVGALEDQDYRSQRAAIKALVAVGGPAVPALTQALDAKSVHTRFGAVSALQGIGPPAEAAIPALLRLLREGKRPERPDQPDLQAEAAAALGDIGAAAAGPALIEVLQDKNYLCVCAALALGKLNDPAAVSPLVGVLMDVDKFWVPRGAAAVALGCLGRLAEPAIPALRQALQFDPTGSGEKWDVRAREAVADALSRIGDPSAQSSLSGKGYRYEMWGIY
jgi:HEAT repeat protein